jgi:prepilin-type N-terminal cleavage/methylation domain-containing protein
MDTHAAFRNRGFTILETVVALAILLIFIMTSVTVFRSVRNMYELNTAVQDVVLAVASAREATLRSLSDSAYSIRVESGQIVRFRGPTYNATSSSNVAFAFPTHITATTSLSNSSSTFSFARLTGVPSATGTITVQSVYGGVATVTLSESGVVRRE